MRERTIVPFHIGPAERALFGWYHPAHGEPARGVGIVLCNPIGDDYVRAHRTLRHLAERLSDAGFAVLRFDFHGTGDSTGDEGDPNRVETWLGDIGLAIDELRARAGVQTISLAGLRMGATLAQVAASRRGDVDSLVLWGPYLTGKAYVAETTRQHKMHALLSPESFEIEPPGREIQGQEALGFFLSDATIGELEKIDLLATQGKPAEQALVIGTGNVPAEEPLLSRLLSVGTATDYRHLAGHKFLITVPHQSAVPVPVLNEIETWLRARYEKSVPTTGAPAPKAPAKPELNEQPLLFGKNRALFGILTSPPKSAEKAGRPAIILINAGTVHRIGPHRAYVRMAREWAELGFHVLRVDLTGIGDSPYEPGTEENLCYPNRGISDVESAMKLLSDRLAVDRFVLVGLCSGADIAFQTGFKDPRVAGAIMMNPRTFCVHDLKMVETYNHTRYFKDSFLDKEKWLKLLRGQVDLARTVRVLAPNLKEQAEQKLERLREKGIRWIRAKTSASAQKDGPETAANDVPACLRLMAQRGVDTFLVVTLRDPGVDYVDLHFAKGMRSLSRVKGFRRADFKGTDHTFTSLYAQKVVTQTISEHLAKNHLSS